MCIEKVNYVLYDMIGIIYDATSEKKQSPKKTLKLYFYVIEIFFHEKGTLILLMKLYNQECKSI